MSVETIKAYSQSVPSMKCFVQLLNKKHNGKEWEKRIRKVT